LSSDQPLVAVLSQLLA